MNRLAQSTDSDAIAHLHAASWRVAYRGALSDAYLAGPIEVERQAVWRQRFAEPPAGQYVVVEQIDDALTGFVCAYGDHDPRWGNFIDNIHVDPARKRQGIGARLMRAVADWAVSDYPGRGVYLWVLESNAPARRFYESLGAQVAGRDTWTPPDGSALPKLRIVWPDERALRDGAERAMQSSGLQGEGA